MYAQYLGKALAYLNKVSIFIIIIMLYYYRILLILILTSFSRITRNHLKWTREATLICNEKVRSLHCRTKTRSCTKYIETNMSEDLAQICLKIQAHHYAWSYKFRRIC